MSLEDTAGQMGQDDDIMFQENETMESAGPNNSKRNHNQCGFRRWASYEMNGPPQFFGPRGPPFRAGPPFRGGPPGRTGSSMRPPLGPPFMWGRGFGPEGPPIRQPLYSKDIKPIKYLMRCGIPREHLKGLPRSILSLMEPEYCGVCAQGFGNFTESSLHYISKNHMKNQKRWLAQSKQGPNHIRELPLKSRDLYCELCDVQITSKNHADLHYAGKLHRAVVEGRKHPKNPYLHQKGMEARVQQLIRREKKHLKPVQEGDPNEEAKKESKTIQPELYCEICKTSVTCTEQMTMHLNGKRHLSREKQHILRMMKGEATQNQDNEDARSNDTQADDADNQGADDADNEGADDDDNQGAEDVDATDKDDDGAQDDYDWGNGSGAWDDDPQ